MRRPLDWMVLVCAAARTAAECGAAREVAKRFAALPGGRRLGEVDTRARVAGAALIAAGVAGLALG